MVLVTVGSQKFPFDRLLIKVDRLVESGIIAQETVMQTGSSSFIPSHCRYQAFYDKETLARLMEQCDILITHGGVGTMIEAVRKGKKTIAVPRLARYKEHVDDHQLQVMREFHAMHLVYACPDVEKLPQALNRVKTHVYGVYPSNTVRFAASVDQFLGSLRKEGR